MNEFFAQKKIHIELHDTKAGVYREHTLTMRPLKIRELPDLFHYLEQFEDVSMSPSGGGLGGGKGQEKGENTSALEKKTFPELLRLIDPTVDGTLFDLPSAILGTIVKIFYDLNFPKDVKPHSGTARRATTLDGKDFVRMLDFLISQGHTYTDIQEYTLPQFRMFIEAASNRLSGKREEKVDPVSALSALGIPVRRVNDRG